MRQTSCSTHHRATPYNGRNTTHSGTRAPSKDRWSNDNVVKKKLAKHCSAGFEFLNSSSLNQFESTRIQRESAAEFKNILWRVIYILTLDGDRRKSVAPYWADRQSLQNEMISCKPPVFWTSRAPPSGGGIE